VHLSARRGGATSSGNPLYPRVGDTCALHRRHSRDTRLRHSRRRAPSVSVIKCRKTRDECERTPPRAISCTCIARAINMRPPTREKRGFFLPPAPSRHATQGGERARDAPQTDATRVCEQWLPMKSRTETCRFSLRACFTNGRD